MPLDVSKTSFKKCNWAAVLKSLGLCFSHGWMLGRIPSAVILGQPLLADFLISNYEL